MMLEATSHAPGLRILVVDDNHDSADSLVVLLKMLGHDAQAAYNAAALDIARDFQPHVFVLDLLMPQMTGLALAEKIRQCPEHKDAMLIALTGFHHEAREQRAHEAGFHHYLLKPVDRFLLQRILEERAKEIQG